MKIPSIYQGCLRKIRFPHLSVAQKAAKKRGFGVYFCECCQGYHLTSVPQRPARPAKPEEEQKPHPVNLQGRPIVREDNEYYYCRVSKKKRYNTLHTLGSPWEATEDETIIKIKKETVHARQEAYLKRASKWITLD